MASKIKERADVNYVLVVGPTDNDPGLAYLIGFNGVTSIKIVERAGPYDFLAYIEVWQGEHLYAELPQHSTLTVEFAPASLQVEAAA
jgi:hypothetical protein